jgi:hypothetical protein
MNKNHIKVILKEINDCWNKKMSNLNEHSHGNDLEAYGNYFESSCDVDKLDDKDVNVLLNGLTNFKKQLDEDLKLQDKLNGCTLDEAKKKRVKQWYEKVNHNYKKFGGIIFPYMHGYGDNDNDDTNTDNDGDSDDFGGGEIGGIEEARLKKIYDKMLQEMYGKSFLKEDSPFKSMEDTRFQKLYNRVISNYPNEKNLYNDLRLKLFTYKSQEQSSKFPINILNKREYPNLIDLIHKLDNVNALINKHKGVKININPDIKDIPVVYHNKEKNISVYRADNIYQSIRLGKGTNFCISSGLNGSKNYYFDYKYGSSIKQKSTIYFVYSPNQIDKYKILAIDYHKDGSFLYTDTDNQDRNYNSYEDMINNRNYDDNDYSVTSPDLKIIPKEVFKWVDQPITLLTDEELKILTNNNETYYNLIKNPNDKEAQLNAVKQYVYAIQYINNPDKDIQIAAVNQDGYAIQYINNPDKDVQLAAVKQYGYAIQYISNPDKEVQLAAIKRNGDAIYYISNPDKEVQIAAVNQDGNIIRFIKNPDKDVQLAAVNQNGNAIQYIKNPDKDVQIAAVNQNGNVIYHINNPDKEIQIAAVNQDGYAIQYIKNPDKDIQLAAVNNDADTIRFIKNPDKEIQLAAYKNNKNLAYLIANPSDKTAQLTAVNQDGNIIRFIKNPDKRVQLQAVNENPQSIKYIDNPDVDVQFASIKNDVFNIQYIKNPDKKIQIIAVRTNHRVYEYIENPCEEATEIYGSL